MLTLLKWVFNCFAILFLLRFLVSVFFGWEDLWGVPEMLWNFIMAVFIFVRFTIFNKDADYD